MRTLPSLLALCISAPALAQFPVVYDAGDAGAPPVAPSPTTQGWLGTVTGSVLTTDVSPDADWGINAWQINDSGPGVATYETTGGWLVEDWTFSVDMRPLAGSVFLYVDTGDLFFDSLFDIELELSGADVLAHRPGVGLPIVCTDAADGAYHNFTLVREFSTFIFEVDFYYDGVFMGTIAESSWGGSVMGQALARFGTGASSGRARFHRVAFWETEPDPLGTNYCSPAVPNSSGQPASITAFGFDVLNANDVTLTASDMPVNRFGYFITSQTQGLIVGPGGSQGNLCLLGINRYASLIQSSGPGGTFSINVDVDNMPTSPASPILPGETWNFQAWFRDVNPMSTSNFSDGVSVLFR